MKEVFLALKPTEECGILCGVEHVHCVSRWICDASLISRYMNDGWHVYRVNGFQRITEVSVELKMEKTDGTECP